MILDKSCKLFKPLFALWASRKLWVSVTAIIIMWGIYWHTAYHVTKLADTLPPEKLALLFPLLDNLYQVMMWGVVTVAVGYTGFQTLQGFSHNTTKS